MRGRPRPKAWCVRGVAAYILHLTQDMSRRTKMQGGEKKVTAPLIQQMKTPTRLHGQSRARDPVQVGLIYCRRPALRGPGSRVGLLLIPTESQPTILPHSPTPVSSSFRLPMTLVVRLWLPCIFCHIYTTTRPRTPQFRGRPCRKSRHMICTDTPIHSLSLVTTLHVTPPKNARVNSP